LKSTSTKGTPAGPTADCNWNDSGCDKRIRDPQLLKDHIRYEHEHAPPRRGNWAGPRIEGRAFRCCKNCGDDFLLLRRYKQDCGKYHYRSVRNLQFNRTEGLEKHLETRKTYRERFHCTRNGAVRAVAELRSASLWWSSESLDMVRGWWLPLEAPVNGRIFRPGFNRKERGSVTWRNAYIPRDIRDGVGVRVRGPKLHYRQN
jgi:hypothetical protein